MRITGALCWADKEEGVCVIRHTFFEKEISAPLVFHAKASHTWRTKFVVLSEELRRRLTNMDSRQSLQDRLVVIRNFLEKMSDSGYDNSTRGEVVKSAIR